MDKWNFKIGHNCDRRKYLENEMEFTRKLMLKICVKLWKNSDYPIIPTTKRMRNGEINKNERQLLMGAKNCKNIPCCSHFFLTRNVGIHIRDNYIFEHTEEIIFRR